MVNVNPPKMVHPPFAFRGEDAAPTLLIAVFWGSGFQPRELKPKAALDLTEIVTDCGRSYFLAVNRDGYRDEGIGLKTFSTDNGQRSTDDI